MSDNVAAADLGSQMNYMIAEILRKLENIEESDPYGSMQLKSIIIKKIENFNKALAFAKGELYQCLDCEMYYSSKYALKVHSCREAKAYASGAYHWYTVTKTGEIRSIKFGWTSNLVDGLRCFSPLPYYAVAHDKHKRLNDPELKRKIDAALEKGGAYDGHLYLGFIENAAVDHDRNKLTAEQSAARTQHAEATCIAYCPNKDMFIKHSEERGKILDDGPSYSTYAERIAADHTNKQYLRFDREQFNDLIKFILNHPEFQVKVNYVKTENKDRCYIASLLGKAELLGSNQRARDFLTKLTKFQKDNGTAFEHLVTFKNNLLNQ